MKKTFEKISKNRPSLSNSFRKLFSSNLCFQNPTNVMFLFQIIMYYVNNTMVIDYVLK